MKKKGEIRNCKTCDKEYEHFTNNRYSLCKKCREKSYLERNRLTEEEKKKPYPLSHNEKKKRYSRLRRELNKSFDKVEWRKIFARELDYIESNGIWTWCLDRRTENEIIEPGSGKIGRKPKGVTDMRIKHPDTRNMPE